MKNKLKIFEQILQEAKDPNNGEYYYLDIDWKDTYGDIINSISELVEEEKFQRFKNLSYIKVDEELEEEAIFINLEDFDELIHCIWSIAKTERIDNGEPNNKNIYYSYLNANWKDIAALANSLGRVKEKEEKRNLTVNYNHIINYIKRAIAHVNTNVFDNKYAISMGEQANKIIDKNTCIICIHVMPGFSVDEIDQYFDFDEPIEIKGYKAECLDEDEADEICDSIPEYRSFSGMRRPYHAHSYPYGESGGRIKGNYCQFYKYTKI